MSRLALAIVFIPSLLAGGPAMAQTAPGPEAQIPQADLTIVLRCAAEGPAAPESCALQCVSATGDETRFEHVHRAAIGRVGQSNASDAALVVALQLNYQDGQSRSALWVGQGAASCHTVVPGDRDARMLEPVQGSEPIPLVDGGTE